MQLRRGQSCVLIGTGRSVLWLAGAEGTWPAGLLPGDSHGGKGAAWGMAWDQEVRRQTNATHRHLKRCWVPGPPQRCKAGPAAASAASRESVRKQARK